METPTLTTKKNSGNIQDQQFKRCASKDSYRYNNCSKSSRSADCGPENKSGASDDQQNYYLDGKSDRYGDGDCHDHDKDRMNNVVPHHGVSGCHNHGHANMDHSSGGFGNVLNQKNEDGDSTDGDRDDDDKDNHTKIRRSPSLNKSKWNFTWKTTQKTSKATELDFLDSDTDFEECARQVVTADAIKSQENPRYDTIQKKRFKRHNDNRKTQSKNREIDEASEEAESIRTDNLATLACPFNNVLVLCEKTQHVNTSFVKENVGSVIKDSKCSKECILQLPEDDVKDRANISSDLPLQKTIQLEDNTLSVERDKRCEDKLIKPEKTAFEVLMERSKAQALLKETSVKAACQEPEKEIVEQAENPNQRQTRNTKGNLKKDKVGKKGRNFKLTSQQNVSGVVGIRENIDEDSCEELEVFHNKNATAAKRKKIDEPKTKDNTYRTSSDDSDKEETTQQESERGAPPGKMSRRTRRKSLRIASKGDNSDSSAQKLKRSSVNEFSSRKGEEATEFCNKAEKERTVVRRIAIKNQWKRKCCHMNEKQVNLHTRYCMRTLKTGIVIVSCAGGKFTVVLWRVDTITINTKYPRKGWELR